NRFEEAFLFHKDKPALRDVSYVHFDGSPGGNAHRWLQRCPAQITVAAVPGDPGGRPLRLRHPIPTYSRVEIPAAVMIRRPRPRLITGPVPTRFGAFPMAVTVRTPLRFGRSGNPAPSVGFDRFPPAIRSERLIEIVLGPNVHGDAHVGGRCDIGRWWGIGRR